MSTHPGQLRSIVHLKRHFQQYSTSMHSFTRVRNQLSAPGALTHRSCAGYTRGDSEAHGPPTDAAPAVNSSRGPGNTVGPVFGQFQQEAEAGSRETSVQYRPVIITNPEQLSDQVLGGALPFCRRSMCDSPSFNFR